MADSFQLLPMFEGAKIILSNCQAKKDNFMFVLGDS